MFVCFFPPSSSGDKLTRVSFFYPHPHFPPPILSSSPTFKTEEPLKNLGGRGGQEHPRGSFAGNFFVFLRPSLSCPKVRQKREVKLCGQESPFRRRRTNWQRPNGRRWLFFVDGQLHTWKKEKEEINVNTVLLYNAKN